MRRLIVLDGPNRGAVLEIGAGTTRLGRERGVELVLPDLHISRQHAAITVGPDGAWMVSDLGSKNATYLNGIRLTGSRPLSNGDELRLGETTLLLIDASGPSDLVAGPAGPDPEGDTAGLPTLEGAPERAVVADAAGRAGRLRYLIGESAGIRQVSELVQRCAPLGTTVLVLGESGTGKELVCEALHRLGPRRKRPFVVVNCATLEPALLESELFGHERGAFTGAVARKIGLLELAADGTLFLDEVGELPLAAQAKLLRAIDRRQFQRVGGTEPLTTEARFVAATHRDLPARVQQGQFREDLYFRLNVAEIRIPPLRERREDIPLLVEHFLSELRPQLHSTVKSVAPEALDALLRYPFPGNVRELKNLLERCLIFASSDRVTLTDLPLDLRAVSATAPALADPAVATAVCAPLPPGPGTTAEALAEVERQHIERVLVQTGWNKTRAAQLLGIDRNTLYFKIRVHRLSGD